MASSMDQNMEPPLGQASADHGGTASVREDMLFLDWPQLALSAIHNSISITKFTRRECVCADPMSEEHLADTLGIPRQQWASTCLGANYDLRLQW